MTGLTVVFGNGAIGHLVTDILTARGERVRIAQRRAPKELPSGVEHVACDVLDRDAVRRAVQGATQVLLAVGFTYDARIWKTVWPKTISNVVEAAAEVGAKVVFIDNLYQLGPQTRPRTEEMALSRAGEKAAILTDVTAIWMAARDRVRFAALRCPDFYGPGVDVSHLGASALGAMANGKSAMLVVPPDTPHDFAYAPDIARAVVTLFDATDDAYGQAWNMPSAPIRTPRDLLQMGADELGMPLKMLAMPLWLLPLAGLFDRFPKEVWDVRYTWDRPYEVNASKFMRRFDFVSTSFEIGISATARSFAAAARKARGGALA
ncbi:MAG: NAD-dependent epimerase/dehydratase family protein [Devosia sp.]